MTDKPRQGSGEFPMHPNAEKAVTVDREQVRQALADYMRSEGCSCCRDIPAHDLHRDRLGQLLEIPPYQDGSGYDFSLFRSLEKTG